MTGELFTRDVVKNTSVMDGNENDCNISNSNGNDNRITNMNECFISANNYGNVYNNNSAPNISSTVDSNDDSRRMLTKNTNINQGSINNSNCDSEKDDMGLKLPVLSECHINSNNCNVKSRVYALFDASDITNISALIFVNSKVNTNNNSSSTSNKNTINIFNINDNNGSIVSAFLSNVSVMIKANSNSTRSRDPVDCFSSFNTSEKSITNENSHDDQNKNPVCVSMSKYNSDKHGNRTNDVLSTNISSITLKMNENMNNYSGASLFTLLTIGMNTNHRDNGNQKSNNNNNSNDNESDHRWMNIDSSTTSIFCGSLSVLQDMYCFTSTAQYYSSNSTSHRRNNMNSNMNGNGDGNYIFDNGNGNRNNNGINENIIDTTRKNSTKAMENGTGNGNINENGGIVSQLARIFLNTLNVDYNTQNTQDILEILQKRNININVNDNINVNNTDINTCTHISKNINFMKYLLQFRCCSS